MRPALRPLVNKSSPEIKPLPSLDDLTKQLQESVKLSLSPEQLPSVMETVQRFLDKMKSWLFGEIERGESVSYEPMYRRILSIVDANPRQRYLVDIIGPLINYFISNTPDFKAFWLDVVRRIPVPESVDQLVQLLIPHQIKIDDPKLILTSPSTSAVTMAYLKKRSDSRTDELRSVSDPEILWKRLVDFTSHGYTIPYDDGELIDTWIKIFNTSPKYTKLADDFAKRR